MRASKLGSRAVPVVQLLLERGADVNKVDNDGKTAADIARNEEIRSLLASAAVAQSANCDPKRAAAPTPKMVLSGDALECVLKHLSASDLASAACVSREWCAGVKRVVLERPRLRDRVCARPACRGPHAPPCATLTRARYAAQSDLTPLHFASLKGHTEVAKLLIKKRAPLYVKTYMRVRAAFYTVSVV